MIQLLGTATPATDAAQNGTSLGAFLVAFIVGLLLAALLAHIFNNPRLNQPPPDFRPIVPGDNALMPPPGGESGGTGAPISGEVHIGRVIVVAPKADSESDRSRN